MFVTGAVGAVFFPAFRQVRDRGDPLGPPYIRVTAFYTAVIWPAMAGVALLAEPLVRLLYGELWLGAAPLLSCIALAQIFHAAIPASSDLPILLGEKRELIRRTVWQTVAALVLIAVALPFGLIWVAASRIAHGAVVFALFAGFTRRLAGFTWSDLIGTYARSAPATLAAIAPTLVAYRWVQGPDALGFIGMAICAATGVACWLATLFATRHQAFGEIVAMARPVLARVLSRRSPPPVVEVSDG